MHTNVVISLHTPWPLRWWLAAADLWTSSRALYRHWRERLEWRERPKRQHAPLQPRIR